MSDSLEEIALDTPCAFCQAQPGVWCTTRSGRTATWLHGLRTVPIYSAYGEGYHEGIRDGQRWARA